MCQKNEYAMESVRVTNVLVLALSTFGKQPITETEYVYGKADKTYSVKGYYQLDPVPRFLIDRLESKGETLDEIIMLCTAETMKAVEKITLSNPDGERVIENISPLEYFRKSLEQDRPSAGITFTTILLDENEPSKAISEAVSRLREIENAEIFLDTHGGFRGVQMTAEAIISLLNRENRQIKPANVWSIKYGYNNQSEIISESSSYMIYDFVSGINECLNYGRIDTLIRLLAEKGIQDKMVDYIKEISDGIQMCLIPVFEDGISHLKQYFDDSRSVSKDPYLALFEDTIKNDYAIMLKNNSSVYDEIIWCMNKGFLQQALTLIVERIPDYLYDHRIINYDNDFKREVENFKKDSNTRLNVYIVNQVFPRLLTEKTSDFQEAISSLKDIIQKSLLDRQSSNQNKIHRSANASSKLIKLGQDENKKEIIVRYNRSDCLEFIRLHSIFHQLRNNVNHANNAFVPSDFSASLINEGIQLYLDYLGRMLTDKVTIEFLLPQNNRSRRRSGNNNNIKPDRHSNAPLATMASLFADVHISG